MSAAGEVQLEVLGRGERPPAVGMRAGAGVLQVAILADLVSGLSIEAESQSGELHRIILWEEGIHLRHLQDFIPPPCLHGRVCTQYHSIH